MWSNWSDRGDSSGVSSPSQVALSALGKGDWGNGVPIPAELLQIGMLSLYLLHTKTLIRSERYASHRLG
jgi:hypothetical protein